MSSIITDREVLPALLPHRHAGEVCYTLTVEKFISGLSWPVAIILCLTLGLAPFSPPHIVEKLQMLMKGRLVRPIDWFDLFLHGAPWLLLILKAAYSVRNR